MKRAHERRHLLPSLQVRSCLKAAEKQRLFVADMFIWNEQQVLNDHQTHQHQFVQNQKISSCHQREEESQQFRCNKYSKSIISHLQEFRCLRRRRQQQQPPSPQPYHSKMILRTTNQQVEHKPTRFISCNNENNGKRMAKLLKSSHLFILILIALKFAVITCEQTATSARTATALDHPESLAKTTPRDEKANGEQRRLAVVAGQQQVHATGNLSDSAEQHWRTQGDYDYDDNNEEHPDVGVKKSNHSYREPKRAVSSLPADNRSSRQEDFEENNNDDDNDNIRSPTTTTATSTQMNAPHEIDADEEDQLVGSDSMRINDRRISRLNKQQTKETTTTEEHSPVTELSRLDSNNSTGSSPPSTVSVQLHQIDSSIVQPQPQPQQLPASESQLPLDLLRQKPNSSTQVVVGSDTSVASVVPVDALTEPLVTDHNYLELLADAEQQVRAASHTATAAADDNKLSRQQQQVSATAGNTAATGSSAKRNIDATLEARAKLRDTVTQLHYNKTLALAGSSSAGNNRSVEGDSDNKWLAQVSPPQSDSFASGNGGGGSSDYEQPFNQELSSNLVSVSVTMAPTNVVEYLNEQRTGTAVGGSDLLEAADELLQQRESTSTSVRAATSPITSPTSSSNAAKAAADWGRRKSAQSRSRSEQQQQVNQQQQQQQQVNQHQQQQQQVNQHQRLNETSNASASYEDIVTWTPAAGPAAYRAGSGFGPSSSSTVGANSSAPTGGSSQLPVAAYSQQLVASSSSNSSDEKSLSAEYQNPTSSFSEPIVAFPITPPTTQPHHLSSSAKKSKTSAGADYLMSGSSSVDYVANETQHSSGFVAAEAPPSLNQFTNKQQRLRLKSQPGMWHLKKQPPVSGADVGQLNSNEAVNEAATGGGGGGGEYLPAESSDGLLINNVLPPNQHQHNNDNNNNNNSGDDDEDQDEDDDSDSNSAVPARGRGQRPKSRPAVPQLQSLDSLQDTRNFMLPIRATSSSSGEDSGNESNELGSANEQPVHNENRYRQQRPQRARGRGGHRQKARKQQHSDEWTEQQQQQRQPEAESAPMQWSPTLAPTVAQESTTGGRGYTNNHLRHQQQQHSDNSDIVLGSRQISDQSDESPSRARATGSSRYAQQQQQQQVASNNNNNHFRAAAASSTSGSQQQPPIIRTFRVSDELNFSPSLPTNSNGGYYNNGSSTSGHHFQRPPVQQQQQLHIDQPTYEAGSRFQAASQHHRQQVSYNNNPSPVGDISMVRPARPQQQLLNGGFAPPVAQPPPVASMAPMQQVLRPQSSSSFTPLQQQPVAQHQYQQQQQSYQRPDSSSYSTSFDQQYRAQPPASSSNHLLLNDHNQQQQQRQYQQSSSRFNSPPVPVQQQQVYQPMMNSNIQDNYRQQQNYIAQPQQQQVSSLQQVRPQQQQMSDHYNNNNNVGSSNTSWSIVTLPYPQPTNNPQSYFSLYNSQAPPVQRQQQQVVNNAPQQQVFNGNKPVSGWSTTTNGQQVDSSSQDHQHLSPLIRPTPVPAYLRANQQMSSSMDPMYQRASMFNMPAPQLADTSTRAQSNQQQQVDSSGLSNGDSTGNRGAREIQSAQQQPPTNAHNSYLTINLKTHATVGPNQLFWEAAAREVAQQQQQQQQQQHSSAKIPVTNGHLPPQHRELPVTNSANNLPMMRRPLNTLRFPLHHHHTAPEPFMAGSHTNGHAYAGQLKPHMAAAAAAALMADHLSAELAHLQSHMSSASAVNPHEISYVSPHSFFAPISLAPPLDADAFNFMASASTMPASAFLSPLDHHQQVASNSSSGNNNSKKSNQQALISAALPLASPATVSDPFGWPMGYGSQAATTLLKVNHVAPPPPYLVPAKVTAAQSSALLYPTIIESPGSPGATALPIKEDPSIITSGGVGGTGSGSAGSADLPVDSADYESFAQWSPVSTNQQHQQHQQMMAEYSMLQPQVWNAPMAASASEQSQQHNHIKVELNTRPPAPQVSNRRARLRHLLRMFSNMRSARTQHSVDLPPVASSRVSNNLTTQIMNDQHSDDSDEIEDNEHLISNAYEQQQQQQQLVELERTNTKVRQKRSLVTSLVSNLIKHPASLLTSNSTKKQQQQVSSRQQAPKLALINLNEQSNRSAAQTSSVKTGFIPLLDNANMIESMESDLLAQAIIFNHQNPPVLSGSATTGVGARDPMMEQLAEAHSMRVVSHAPLTNQPVIHADPPQSLNEQSIQQQHSMALQQQQQQQQEANNLMLYMPLEETASLGPPANEPFNKLNGQHSSDNSHQLNAAASSKPVASSSRERLKRLSKSIIRSSRKPLTKLIKMTSGFRLPALQSGSNSSATTNQQQMGSAMASSNQQVSIAQKLNTVVSPEVMMTPPQVSSLDNFNRFALPLQQWYQYQQMQQQQQQQTAHLQHNDMSKFRSPPVVLAPPPLHLQQQQSVAQQQQQQLLPLATAHTQQVSPYSLLTSSNAKQQFNNQFVQPVAQQNQQFAASNSISPLPPNVSFPDFEQQQQQQQPVPQPPDNNNHLSGSGGANRGVNLLSSQQRADSMNRFSQALQLYSQQQPLAANLIAPLLRMRNGSGKGNAAAAATVASNQQVSPHRSSSLMDEMSNQLRRSPEVMSFRRSNISPMSSLPMQHRSVSNHFNLSSAALANLTYPFGSAAGSTGAFSHHFRQWYPPANGNSWLNNNNAHQTLKRDFNLRHNFPSKQSVKTRQFSDNSDAALSLFYKPNSTGVTYTDEVLDSNNNHLSAGSELSEATALMQSNNQIDTDANSAFAANEVVESPLVAQEAIKAAEAEAATPVNGGSGDFTLEQQQQFQQQLLNHQQQQQFNPLYQQFNAAAFAQQPNSLLKPRLPKFIPSINSMANKFRQHLFQTLKLNPLANKWPALATYPKYPSQVSTNYMALPSMPIESQVNLQQQFHQQQKQPSTQQQVAAGGSFYSENQLSQEDQSATGGGGANQVQFIQQQAANQAQQFHQQQQHQQHQVVVPNSSVQQQQEVLQSRPPVGAQMEELVGENGSPVDESSLLFEQHHFRPDNDTASMNNFSHHHHQLNGLNTTITLPSEDAPVSNHQSDMYDQELLNQHSDSLPGMSMGNGSDSALSEFEQFAGATNQTGIESQMSIHEEMANTQSMRNNNNHMTDVSNNLITSDGSYIPEKGPLALKMSHHNQTANEYLMKQQQQHQQMIDSTTIGAQQVADTDPSLYHNRNLSAAASTDAADVTIHHHHVITTSDDSDAAEKQLDQVKQHMLMTSNQQQQLESPVHPGGFEAGATGANHHLRNQMYQPQIVDEQQQQQEFSGNLSSSSNANELQQVINVPEGVAYQANFESSRTGSGNGSHEDSEEQQQQVPQSQQQQQQYEADRVQVVRPVVSQTGMSNYQLQQQQQQNRNTAAAAQQKQRKVQQAQVQVNPRLRTYSNVSTSELHHQQVLLQPVQQQQVDYQVIKASDPAKANGQQVGAFRMQKLHLPENMVAVPEQQPNEQSSGQLNGVEAQGDSVGEDQQQQLGGAQGQQVYEPVDGFVAGSGGSQMMFSEQSIGEQQEHQPPPVATQVVEVNSDSPQQQQSHQTHHHHQQQQQQQHVYLDNNLDQLQPVSRAQVIMGHPAQQQQHYKPQMLMTMSNDSSLEYNFTPVFARVPAASNYSTASVNYSTPMAGERLLLVNNSSTGVGSSHKQTPVSFHHHQHHRHLQHAHNMSNRGSPTSATTSHEQYLVLEPQPPAAATIGSIADASTTSAATGGGEQVVRGVMASTSGAASNISDLPAVFVSVKPERVIQQQQKQQQVRRHPLKMPKSARPRLQQVAVVKQQQVNQTGSHLFTSSTGSEQQQQHLKSVAQTVPLIAGKPTDMSNHHLSHHQLLTGGSEIQPSKLLNATTAATAVVIGQQVVDDNIKNHNLRPSTAKPMMTLIQTAAASTTGNGSGSQALKTAKSRIRWQGMSGNGNRTSAANATTPITSSGALEPASSELSRREQAYLVSKMTAAAYAVTPSDNNNNVTTTSTTTTSTTTSTTPSPALVVQSPQSSTTLQPLSAVAAAVSNHKHIHSSYASNLGPPTTPTDASETRKAGKSVANALRAAARAQSNHKRSAAAAAAAAAAALAKPDSRTGSTSFRLSTGAGATPNSVAQPAGPATTNNSLSTQLLSSTFSERPTVFLNSDPNSVVSAADESNSTTTYSPRTGQVIAPPLPSPAPPLVSSPELSLTLANRTTTKLSEAVGSTFEQQHLREDTSLALEDRLATQVRKRRHREPSAQLIDLLKMSSGRARSVDSLAAPEVAELRVRLTATTDKEHQRQQQQQQISDDLFAAQTVAQMAVAKHTD